MALAFSFASLLRSSSLVEEREGRLREQQDVLVDGWTLRRNTRRHHRQRRLKKRRLANDSRSTNTRLTTSTEGVMVAKKDFEIKHNDIDTRNLYVRSSSFPNPTSCPNETRKGHQSRPIPDLARLPAHAILVAVVLLHADARGSRLPARVAAPARRDRARHAHQAAAFARAAPRHAGRRGRPAARTPPRWPRAARGRIPSSRRRRGQGG